MLKKTTSYIFNSIIGLLFICASCLIILRLLFPNLNHYNVEIAEYLSAKLNKNFTIDSIEAQWVDVYPKLLIHNIKIQDRYFLDRSMKIDQVNAELDILQSLLTLSPIFKKLIINRLDVKIEQVEGKWLSVFSPRDQNNSNDIKQSASSLNNINRILKVVSEQSEISFTDSYLTLKPQKLPSRVVGPMQLLMENTTDIHQLSGQAKLKYYGNESKVMFSAQTDALAKVISETPISLYASFENLSEKLLEFNLINLGVHPKELSIDSEMWATLKLGAISDIVGSVDINNLVMQSPVYPILKNSTFNFSVSADKDLMKMQLADINLSDGEEHLSIKVANAIINNQTTPFLQEVAISNVDLTDITDYIKNRENINVDIKEVVDTLDLKGKLENLIISWKDVTLKDFQLSADLKGVSVNSYKGAPEARNVTGLISATANKGEIHLNTNEFGFYFPDLFPKKWQYEKAKGKISWQLAIDDQAKLNNILINSELISLSNGKMKTSGRFSVNIPTDKKHQTELILLIGMKDNNAKDVLSYIPPKLIGASLTNWINSAVLEGHLNDGGFLLRSGFRKNVDDSFLPSVQLYLNLDSVIANFDNNWPNYHGDDLSIFVKENQVLVRSKVGEIANNHVTNLTVTKQKDSPEILVNLDIKGDLEKLTEKIKQKSAVKYIPEPLRKWLLSGLHTSALKLRLPIGEKESDAQIEADNGKENITTPYINIRSHLSNAQIIDKLLDLNFSKINGDIYYDSKTGLLSKDIKLTADGYPAELSILSKLAEQHLKTSITLKSIINVADLSEKFSTSNLKFAEGKAAYDARFDFCWSGDTCNQLVINSDLTGVSFNLPAPWGKKSKNKSKLQIVNTASGKETVWLYNYADLVRGASFISDKETSTMITLGGNKPQRPKESGLSVNGQIKGVELKNLFSALDLAQPSSNVNTKKDSKADTTILRSIDLKLASSTLFGKELGTSAWLNLTKSKGYWIAKFNSAVGAGQIKYPDNRQKAIEVTLNKLSLETNTDRISSKNSSAEKIDINNLPKISLDIKQLEINKLNVGQWKANSGPTKEGYKISDIEGKIAETLIQADVSWLEQKAGPQSFLSLDAKGGDFGTVLTQFGYSKVLENKSGDVQARLSWIGYPWSFDQKNLNGRASFSLKKGRIIEAGNSANFLRIFGILNLNTVIKRLKLDFRDIVDKGVTFDSVTGKYYLQDGLATSQEPLKLKGSSASIEMTGAINFVEKSLDQKMIVEIPLTSNAPIAALLLASPQIAGVAFVVDKIFGKKLAKLTALKYSISGSWFEPNIKITN